MKQTNKKEFSKFLNKFEKLLDYHVEVLGKGIKLNLFDGNTEQFLKTSHCKFVSKGDNSDIAVSSSIDLSDVGMQEYDFFKNKNRGDDNYKLYKNFVRLAITKFDFLYNNLDSSGEQAKNSNVSYLNSLNALFNVFIQGNTYSSQWIHHLLILQDVEERHHLFGESPYFFSDESLLETFKVIVRKIEISILESDKPEKSDIISLLNLVNLFRNNGSYNEFTDKLNLACILIAELKQTTKFKLEESKHKNIYNFVRDITTNKANNLIVSSIRDKGFCFNGERYTSELKVSDLKSIFRLVAKK